MSADLNFVWEPADGAIRAGPVKRRGAPEPDAWGQRNHIGGMGSIPAFAGTSGIWPQRVQN